MERSAAEGWMLSLDDDAAECWLCCVGVGGSTIIIHSSYDAGGTDTALAQAAACLSFSSCISDGSNHGWLSAGVPLFSNGAAQGWLGGDALDLAAGADFALAWGDAEPASRLISCPRPMYHFRHSNSPSMRQSFQFRFAAEGWLRDHAVELYQFSRAAASSSE